MEPNDDWNKKFEDWEEEKPKWEPFHGNVREPWPIFILVLLVMVGFLALAIWGTWDFLSILKSDVEAVEKAQSAKSLAILWGVCIGFWTACMAGNHVLCHAPDHPRIASLLVRKEFRNF